jgi:hypothetical protein
MEYTNIDYKCICVKKCLYLGLFLLIDRVMSGETKEEQNRPF